MKNKTVTGLSNIAKRHAITNANDTLKFKILIFTFTVNDKIRFQMKLNN